MTIFRTTIIAALALSIWGCDKKEVVVDEGQTAAQPSISAAAPTDASVVQLALPNQRSPYHGMVTSGQPDQDTFGKLRDAGYGAVVNLRTEAEDGYWDEKSAATRQMMIYLHMPIGGADDLTRENVEKFAKIIEQPLAKQNKVLVHCGSGNRAGALVALKAAWIDGRSAADALELGKKAGLSELEEAVKAKLAEP